MQNNNSMVLVHHQKNGTMTAFARGQVVDFSESERDVILLGRKIVIVNIKKKKPDHTLQLFWRGGLSDMYFLLFCLQ